MDQIYHPEYRSFDLRTGIYTNIDDDKVIVTTENEEIFTSYPDVLYENDEFLCIIAYQKVSDPETRYRSFITAINYKEGKDAEIEKLNKELDSFKKTIEDNNSLYESMLDKTTRSLEKIISKTESLSKIQ